MSNLEEIALIPLRIVEMLTGGAGRITGGAPSVRTGTSTTKPTFVASQQKVAAATHTTTGEGRLPPTAQQRGPVLAPRVAPIKPPRGGKGRLI